LTRYNWDVQPKQYTRWFLILAVLAGIFNTAASSYAPPPAARSARSSQISAYDLIMAMNTLRVAYGNAALIEDPIINAVAQSTAEIMAASQMSWHIGNVSGRISSAGYGGGGKVFATENFAVGFMSIDEIMVAWSDESHMFPAVNAAYCHIGAGVAHGGNGRTYYVLQAAYVSGKSCGEYTSTGGTSSQSGGSTSGGTSPGVPQWIIPVKIATPDANGKVIHVVEAGQSMWAIAIAYKITIKDLQTWNNLPKDSKLQIGQELFIPGSNTEGYSTPTPVGMVQVSTPDAGGKIVHTVQAYQTLSTIAQAYGVKIDTILALNGIQAEWPLQIDQKLLIDPGDVTPSPTPRPLTPIEKLTPAPDGKYYHTVGSGESLSWIAGLYGVNMMDLMAWNGLGQASILQPNQKLVLQVTPPATITPTPGPPTATFTATATAIPSTSTPTQTATAVMTGTPVQSAGTSGTSPMVWFAVAGLAAGGLLLLGVMVRKKP
jgi:LysM repeat protein